MIVIRLTPEQFNSRKEDVAKLLGTELPGDTGTISHDGVTVTYTYDGSSVMSLNVDKKPMLVPSATVENKIRAWFNS